MKPSKIFLISVFCTTVEVSVIFAQPTSAPPANATAPPSAPVQRSQADLEKLVAPIALYPDPLLATLLPASAYPIDIVQAARFIEDTNNIAKIDSQPWDQNVKALARFPDVIAKMNKDIAWTSDLGQAFVDDQKAVMDAIQTMRGKAQTAGSLKTTPQQVVVVTNEVVQKVVEQQLVVVTNTIVQIQPAQPQVIYVPQYNPTVVYAPPPPTYDPMVPLMTFGIGMAVGAAIANDCDWHSGGVYVGHHGAVVWGGGDYHGDIDVNRNVNVNRSANVNVNQTVNQKWQADPNRRTSTAKTATPQARGWTGQGAAGTPAARAQPTAASQWQGAPGAQGSSVARGQGASAPRAQPPASAPAARPQAAPSSFSSAGRAGGSAFNNSGGAAQARSASARGSFSRGGGGGAPRGGGGRR